MASEQGKEQFERHYDREERLAMMPEALIKLKTKKKGFFRNNKSLVIMLADIVLLLLLFLAFLIYSKISSNTSTINNYNFVLKGYVYDSKALISLTILNTLDSSSAVSESKPFEATITLSGHKDFYKKVYDIMPDPKNREITMRAAIPLEDYYTTAAQTVFAEVKFDNTTVKLKYNLKKEK